MRSAPRVVRAATGALATICLVLAGGCALQNGDTESTSSTAKAAPALSSTEPLADPRDWTGAVTAEVADPAIDPVGSPEPALPVTVTDDQGKRVTVTDAGRILALDVYGTYSRTVFELGLGDRVVGRDVSTQFAEAKDLPLVTGQGHELSAEAILKLDPTVVLVDTTLGPWSVVEQLRSSDIAVVVLPSTRTIDGVPGLIGKVARALGVPDAGKRLAARTSTAMKDVEAQIAAVAPQDDGKRLRTVFLYVRGNAGVYYMFGEGSGADSLIDSLGLYDVAAEIDWSGMKPVTDEGIVAAQPDLILMMTGGLTSVGGVDGLLEKLPALAQTPAGQNHRVVAMDDSDILGFGPLTAEVLNALAVAVYAPGAVASPEDGS